MFGDNHHCPSTLSTPPKLTIGPSLPFYTCVKDVHATKDWSDTCLRDRLAWCRQKTPRIDGNAESTCSI